MPEASPRRVNWVNVIFLVGTLLVAAVSTPWYLATHGLGWPEGLTFVLLWLAVGISVTGGYHRLFAHRTYQASWPVKLVYLVFGAGALENSVIKWAADHRVHHSNVDHERDPYNIQKGFWWAHMGWIFFEGNPPGPSVVRDLTEDPLVMWQDRWYVAIGLGVAFGIPLIVGLATGRLLGCMLIGGVLRVVVSHHGTFFINSLCHMVGRQPYSREHSARDSSVMAVLAFGEGYHNYHHSFPFDYRNGIKGWHFDPAKWTIWSLSLVGLTGDLRRASDAVVLKARIDVQFERAKEKLERVVAGTREGAETRLHEAHERLQAVLRDLVALQRQLSRKVATAAPAALAAAPSATVAAAAAGDSAVTSEPAGRMAAMQQALEQALSDWQQALREMKRLPRVTRVATAAGSIAGGLMLLIGLIGLIGLAVSAAGASVLHGATNPGQAPLVTARQIPMSGPTGEAPPPAATTPYERRDWPEDVIETAGNLRDEAVKGTRAMSILESLTTEVGPRPAGSAGDRAAVAWAVRTLKELGFSNVHTEKVTVPHWERGAEAGEIVAPYPQKVVLTALGGSAATPPAGIEAGVVAVTNLTALAKMAPAQVQGKIVYFSGHLERRRDELGYENAVQVRGQGPAAAAKLGAVAVIVRSVGTDSNRLPHTGATRYDSGGKHIPAAALSAPDSDLLDAELKSGKPVRFHLKLVSRNLPAAESANVIGEIPGNGKPEEVVLLGAHLDSWDLGTGAIDDGAGVAIVTEAARRIGELKTKPHRTLRVVLFANEEFGLSGAEAYAKAHAAELAHHVVALESDLGSGRVWRVESYVPPAEFGWLRGINQLVFKLGAASGANEKDGGADLGPLLQAGVPSLTLVQDAVGYFDIHHSANDTLDKVNKQDLDYNVAAWAAVAYAVADMPGDFGRVKAAPRQR